MTQLTALQLTNVAALIGLLSNGVADAEYNHRWCDPVEPGGPYCAAGHAYRNSQLFQSDEGVQFNPESSDFKFKYNFGGAFQFGQDVFGDDLWRAVFASYAFGGNFNTANVTRHTVIARLQRIAESGLVLDYEEYQTA